MSEILKMKDEAENYRVAKDDLFNLPMKLLVIGKSELSGKTNLVGNICLRPFGEEDTNIGKQMYRFDFKGDNIYIVCPSATLDSKWRSIIDGKKIPEGNIYNKYDEEELNRLYDRLSGEFEQDVAAGRKPDHKLVILDDCSYSGDLKSKLHGALARLFMNGRHLLISTVVTAQKYSDVHTGARENCTGCFLFDCSQKQLELVYMDHGLNSKKEFTKMFRDATKERHSFMVINYSNPVERRFMNSKFEPIK